MNSTIVTGISPALLERLAGSLLHFVWQGAAIAILAAATLSLMHRRSSEARYAAALAALLAMVAAPVLTFAFYAETGAVALRLVRGLNGATAVAVTEASAAGVAVWTQRIVFVWFLGVVVFFARLLGGWLLSRRLVREATAVVNPIVLDAMDRARSALNFHRSVRLLTGVRIEAPIVIGWLRPAILLPVSALTGLEPEQVLAILAHELAHIRRYDFLVNAVQRSVECVLFYHPAVWWISQRIRVERERCCDDLAVKVCGDRLVYAQALIALEKARSMEPVLSVSAADGVTDRVRRILGARSGARDWQSAVAALLFVAILVGAGMWQPPALAGSLTVLTPPTPLAAEIHRLESVAPLTAIAAIATAQGPARPVAPPAQTTPVAPPVIAPSREAARDRLGQLRVDYSVDSFVKQAGEGDSIAVKTFLQAGMNINVRDSAGFTAVLKATQMKQTETVQALLAAGADPNAAVTGAVTGEVDRGVFGVFPLAFAVRNGDIPTLKVLLAGGAVDVNGALGIAAEWGRREAVLLLLDHKAVDSSALQKAACAQDFDVVKILLDRGMSFDAKSARSVLNCAAAGYSNLRENILENTEFIATMLDKAALSGPEDQRLLDVLLRTMLQTGRDVRKRTATALLLLDRGAKTELNLAVESRLVDVVRALLAKAENASLAPPLRTLPPLSAALSSIPDDRVAETVEIVRLLAERGADVNESYSSIKVDGAAVDGRTLFVVATPLVVAVLAKKPALVSVLLEKGADPNGKTKNGLTPLAAAKGNAEITQLLLNAGAK